MNGRRPPPPRQQQQQQQGPPLNAELAELVPYADCFWRSQLFNGVNNVAQGLVLVLAGKELGLTPFQAIQSLHVIEGRPALAANAYASYLRKHPYYDYRVLESTDDACEIEFTRDRRGRKDPELLGSIRITIADAERKGWTKNKSGTKDKDNWKFHPDAMLFARAISRGCRKFAPDVFSFAVYTPEELEDGLDDAIPVQSRVVEPEERSAPPRAPEPARTPETEPRAEEPRETEVPEDIFDADWESEKAQEPAAAAQEGGSA